MTLKSPREHKNHRERGPKKYFYTMEDLSQITGLKASTLRYLRRKGEFDPMSLLSVLRFINKGPEPALE